MSLHIGAPPGMVAPRVLLPGDPMRAKWIAETFLDDARCYSEVRGMLGYTGSYRGERVSVQGSGMGLPSMSIYANELFDDYDVQAVVRVGSCGALTEDLRLRDLVIASGACTDSSMNRIRFEGLDYAPVPDFGLLRTAHDAAVARGLEERTAVGLIFSGDSFYSPRPELVERMVAYGVLAIEMEASALYTLAARHRRRALAICTVSDHVVTGEQTTALERQETFSDMVLVALEAMLAPQPRTHAQRHSTKSQ
jgi:purine-nucleoside phosphorylase